MSPRKKLHVPLDVCLGARQRNGDTHEHGCSFSDQRGGFSMARILVMDERQDRILLDEFVHPIHIEDEHASLQIIERLAWAIRDASHTDRTALGKR